MVNPATSAKAILDGRGITRVVVGDDDVGQPSWYGLVELLPTEDKADIGQEAEFDLLASDWRDRLDLADSEVRKLIGAKVNALAEDHGIPRPAQGTEDPALAALHKILKSHQPQQLTPDQWQARASDFLDSARSEPTLFLIDQRLGDGREGGSLVKDLLDKESGGCSFCILTSDVGVDNEFEYWQQMCGRYGLRPGQVGIVAKEHLTNDQIGFARMLKISLTAGEVEAVRSGVSDAVRQGLEAGLERFSALDLPTLTSLVFESSHVEGTWEVETILRVVRAFVDESLENQVYGDHEIADAVKLIAAAAAVGTGTDERLTRAAFDIQHAERYVTGDYLAGRRMALANGDLFEITGPSGTTSLCVLVAQGCDLAIRSNGKRNGSPTHLTVLPVEQRTNAPPGAHVELLHHSPTDESRVFVRLTKPFYVQTAILDLAAFSATGEAVWTRETDVSTMRVVGWQKRATKVSEQFERAFQIHEQLENDSSHRIGELSPLAVQHPDIHAVVEGQVISYPIKRVGRLRERPAEAVLQAYGIALSRTAEAHDLARITS